ncbi:MAG: chemotaxis protein CheA [Terracidiphilus sp.]|jgi:two-component system chemotaxis sensor kinase CheA
MKASPSNPLPSNPLLEQFLAESHELLEGIGQKLMQLEDAPTDQSLVNELFRMVHTLKGNSGLFTFPEMTRVLHAGEDLLGEVRNGKAAFSRELADRLLDAMDFVGLLLNEIESTGRIDASRAADSARLAESLRVLLAVISVSATIDPAGSTPVIAKSAEATFIELPPLSEIPEVLRIEAFRRCGGGEKFHWIAYQPAPECFFQGDDPFHRARQTPGLLWGSILPSEPLPPLAELDTYKCSLKFHLLTAGFHEELVEHFRYVPDQVTIVAVDPLWLAISECEPENTFRIENDLVSASPVSAPERSLEFTEETAALTQILTVQEQILALEDRPAWLCGRLKAVAAVLKNLANSSGYAEAEGQIEASLAAAVASARGLPLLEWLNAHQSQFTSRLVAQSAENAGQASAEEVATSAVATPAADDGIKFGRRAEDNQSGPRSLKVDQAKIDRLMNLIGELVVEKNALPYLAQRAEAQYGVRELSREIKGQYSVINRIADEMQDAIMQVRMMAVSIVFQRFPRLVRDTSRKLGKEVRLVLEGEQTEADKNIIESLADPLIHIVRNSLDHGLETPEVRRACGKPETGTLTIRAAQQADRVVIEIIDDGKGIDPAVIKQKAYVKGLIDEATLERIGDQEAINLIFAAGLSTAEVISDLSGRGVGMDVVRSAVQKINGTVAIESELGKGTSIRISLPLSMAVTQVMVIESDGQLFGVPMDNVVETIRVPRSAIHAIKQSLTAVLRGRIVPLKSLNTLLGIPSLPLPNSDDELAVLLVQAGSEVLGLMVDSFKETIGLIQKPLGGFLNGLSAYSGSALMGDGSVLMILNIREMV